MKNTEKNSWKTNLSRYLFFFFLLLLIIFGGVYWYITEPERQLSKDISEIKNAQFEYINLDNDRIVQYNESNIQEEEYLIEKLEDSSTKLTQKQRKAFSKLLKELTSNINKKLNQEELEGKTKEEKKSIILEILKKNASLSKLNSKIESPITPEKKINKIKEQDEWIDRFYPNGFQTVEKPHEEKVEIPKGEKIEEDEKIFKEINKLMEYFYKKFMLENDLKPGKMVQPLLTTEGDEIIPDKTPPEKIEEARNQLRIQGVNNVDKKMDVIWRGFGGWHKKWDEEKGTSVVGLTSYTSSSLTKENSLTYRKCQTRDISITLDARFPFSRKGKGYETWENKEKKFKGLKIGWYSLIETIAHELAHAIINTTIVSYREDAEKGGHGNLHRQYNIEMKELINKDEEGKTKRLKEFWFKK